MKSLSCPNRQCPLARKASSANIIGHGFYRTNRGRRRRYRCSTCGKTFCSNTGTPYHRLHHRRATFDEVAALSVEGLNKSASARVKRIRFNAGCKGLQALVAASTIERQPDAPSLNFRQTRFVRSSVARNNPSGSSPRSRSGRGFGLRRRGKTKLSKHTHPLPGHLQPNESRTCPSDHH